MKTYKELLDEKTQIVTDYGEKHTQVYSAVNNFVYYINQVKKESSYHNKNFSAEEKKVLKKILKYAEKAKPLADEWLRTKQEGKDVR